jgi:hypothetical protein
MKRQGGGAGGCGGGLRSGVKKETRENFCPVLRMTVVSGWVVVGLVEGGFPTLSREKAPRNRMGHPGFLHRWSFLSVASRPIPLASRAYAERGPSASGGAVRRAAFWRLAQARLFDCAPVCIVHRWKVLGRRSAFGWLRNAAAGSELRYPTLSPQKARGDRMGHPDLFLLQRKRRALRDSRVSEARPGRARFFSG